MRYVEILLLLACVVIPLPAQEKAEAPTNEKAQKTYNEAFSYLRQRNTQAALDSFKKADKQDGGHCAACQKRMIKLGIELRDWKTAETAAEFLAEAHGARDIAVAHFQEWSKNMFGQTSDKRAMSAAVSHPV